MTRQFSDQIFVWTKRHARERENGRRIFIDWTVELTVAWRLAVGIGWDKGAIGLSGRHDLVGLFLGPLCLSVHRTRVQRVNGQRVQSSSIPGVHATA